MATAQPVNVKPKSPKKAAEETNPDFQLPGIGNYVFVKTLGEGNFAKVKLAKHKMTGQEVAIKVIDKTQLDEKKLSKLYREVRIMKLLHHPNIVRLYEVIETKSTVFLVMECCTGGELYDYLVVHGRMKEKEARAKFRQILSAVSYCHKKRVIHRDLKAENLLLDHNLDIKIADFGFSNHFDPEGKLDTFCGSPPYAAPELFQGRRYVGPEVDVWSLGVILYVLTTGCLPFDGKNLQEMRESVCRGKYRIPFYLSDPCEKLLRKFLVRESNKRADLSIIADDPWIMDGYTEPPICSDLSMKIDEDENLIKLLEQKFHLPREVILKSLRGDVYDDISALYYLMYHERDKAGDYSRVNQVLGNSTPSSPISPPVVNGAASSTQPALNSVMPLAAITLPRKPVSAVSPSESSPSSPPEMPPGSANTIQRMMATITEDGQSSADGAKDAAGAPAGVRTLTRASASAPRRRRFTVGGEAEMTEKFGDTPEGKDAAEQLKRLQTAVREDGPASAPPVPHGNGHDAAMTSPVRYATLQPSRHSAHQDEVPASPVSPDSPTSDNGGEDGPRRRNNTIVGILRSTISRSKASTADGASAMASTEVGAPTASTTGVDKDGKPRSLRFTFNSNTTSSKPPDDVVNQILEACVKLNVQHKLISRYLVECTFAVPQTREMVRFEVEVCKLPRLKNLHGLKIKRLGGPSNDYKMICESLLSHLTL
ncbi:hypothetical protein RI367_003897 [Sorochytrium milnesiophthora]